MRKIRNVLSYIFTIPATIFFWLGERVRGGRLGWRVKEVVECMEFRCTKCGHEGKPIIIDKHDQETI